MKVEQQCWLAHIKCTRGVIGTRNVPIRQSSKMAMWLLLQHDYPRLILIYRAINTHETVTIKYHLLLVIFSRIANINHSSRPVELRKVDSLISKNQVLQVLYLKHHVYKTS